MKPISDQKRAQFPQEKEGRKFVKTLEEAVKFSHWVMQLQAPEYERPPPNCGF